jgi:hypothetical protein
MTGPEFGCVLFHGRSPIMAVDLKDLINREILSIALTDDALFILFADIALKLQDTEPFCCESRYFHTDDDLASFVGQRFMGFEIRDGPTEDIRGDNKESQFLLISTDRGVCTVVAYVLHGGYYGGFQITAEVMGIEHLRFNLASGYYGKIKAGAVGRGE